MTDTEPPFNVRYAMMIADMIGQWEAKFGRVTRNQRARAFRTARLATDLINDQALAEQVAVHCIREELQTVRPSDSMKGGNA